jgi:hypothetical protein
MRSDDLVPYLAKPDPGPGVGFRQGTIVSWDPTTAENQVLVGSSLMTNLPILNTSEASILAAGDVVGILTAGRTWGILGRFTIPDTPEAVSSLSSLRTASADVATAESRSVNTMGDLATLGPEVTISIGPSGRALVTLTALVDAAAAAFVIGPQAGGAMGFAVSGANTLAASTANSLFKFVTWQTGGADTAKVSVSDVSSRQVLLTGLNPGSTIFTCKYQTLVSGQNCTFQVRNITVVAL